MTAVILEYAVFTSNCWGVPWDRVDGRVVGFWNLCIDTVDFGVTTAQAVAATLYERNDSGLGSRYHAKTNK